MNGNPTATKENEGCKSLTPPLAPPQTGCEHAGGDLEPPLAPSGGASKQVHLRACTPSTCTPPKGETDPLATPGLLRFLLGKTASQALAEAGQFFTVQAYQSPRPEDAGRFILLALPCSKEVADAAARVALGTHRATRIKTPATPKPALTPKQLRTA